jgi:hypothetical protein
MMGSTRRLGASRDSENKPQVRITGVFKGSDTLTDMLNSEEYFGIGCLHGKAALAAIQNMINDGWLRPEHVQLDQYPYPLPILNVVNGIALGVIDGPFIDRMRSQLSEDEFIRQLLCINIQSRNLIWETDAQRARQMGLKANILPVEPVPGEQYKKRGIISFGYDHSGHGETPQSSRYAFIVDEQISNHTCTIFARTWAPGTDETIVKNDLLAYWRYFNPDSAIGDAYGIGLLTTLNDELYSEGLTMIDRRSIGDGQSTATTWQEWAFRPLRFEGMVKHSMAQSLRSLFVNKQSAIAYFDENDSGDLIDDLRLFMSQLTNMTALASRASYSSYKMVNNKIGDDLFDAKMASTWGLLNRGAVQIAPVVHTRLSSRADLLRVN